MSGFDNEVVYGKNADFTSVDNQNVLEANGLATNGQLWIGTTAVNVGGTHINVGTLTSPDNSVTFGYTSPNITAVVAGGSSVVTKLAPDIGTSPVIPNLGIITITGSVVAAGTSPVRTDGTAASTMAIEVQRSQALAATDATKVGLANFDSAAFDVDANGFVQLNGGGIASTSFDVQANTAPGTDPVVPTAAGVVTINGAVVANHSVVLETQSRAANAYNLEVQYATSAAATDGTKSGVSHFNNAQFTVDASGFVSTSGTGVANTITGNTGGARSPTAGNWNLITSNSTPVFAGAASTLTLNFGLNNLALGTSMPALTSGGANVGLGNGVLLSTTTGGSNTAIGISSLQNNVGGGSNTAVGNNTMFNFTSDAGPTATNNTAIGNLALNQLLTGTNNTALGNRAGFNYTTTETSNISIRNLGTVGESNVIRIGTQGTGAGEQNVIFAAGIVGTTVTGNFVNVKSDGQLGEVSSSTGVIQTITGDSGGALSPSSGNFNILGGPGVTTSGSGSTLTINSVVFTDQGGTTSVTSDSGSFATAAITLTLPAAPVQGEVCEFVATTAAALVVDAPGTQLIRAANAISSAGGTITSSGLAGDSITLRYRATGTTWYATSIIGVWVTA